MNISTCLKIRRLQVMPGDFATPLATLYPFVNIRVRVGSIELVLYTYDIVLNSIETVYNNTVPPQNLYGIISKFLWQQMPTGNLWAVRFCKACVNSCRLVPNFPPTSIKSIQTSRSFVRIHGRMHSP